MSKSKYHTEPTVMAVGPDGKEVEVPRSKAFRTSNVKDTGQGRVRVFASKVYKVNKNGSLDNMKAKLTKAEKKQAKRERQQGRI